MPIRPRRPAVPGAAESVRAFTRLGVRLEPLEPESEKALNPADAVPRCLPLPRASCRRKQVVDKAPSFFTVTVPVLIILTETYAEYEISRTACAQQYAQASP